MKNSTFGDETFRCKKWKIGDETVFRHQILSATTYRPRTWWQIFFVADHFSDENLMFRDKISLSPKAFFVVVWFDFCNQTISLIFFISFVFCLLLSTHTKFIFKYSEDCPTTIEQEQSSNCAIDSNASKQWGLLWINWQLQSKQRIISKWNYQSLRSYQPQTTKETTPKL